MCRYRIIMHVSGCPGKWLTSQRWGSGLQPPICNDPNILKKFDIYAIRNSTGNSVKLFTFDGTVGSDGVGNFINGSCLGFDDKNDLSNPYYRATDGAENAMCFLVPHSDNCEEFDYCEHECILVVVTGVRYIDVDYDNDKIDIYLSTRVYDNPFDAGFSPFCFDCNC